jgi:hypothetical protein
VISSRFFLIVGRVFSKLGLVVPENVIKGVIDMKAGIVEVVLNNLRLKLESVCYLSLFDV